MTSTRAWHITAMQSILFVGSVAQVTCWPGPSESSMQTDFIDPTAVLRQAREMAQDERVEGQLEAVRLFEKARSLCRHKQDIPGEARALLSMAKICFELGRTQDAASFAEEARSLHQRHEDTRGRIEAEVLLALAQLRMGDNQKAMRLCQDSLRISRERSDLVSEARSTHCMAEIYLYLGDPYEALSNYLSAKSLWQQVGNRPEELHALVDAANAYSDLALFDEASKSFEAALAGWNDRGSYRGIGEARVGMGHLAAKLGRFGEAIRSYEQAAKAFRLIGDPNKEGMVLSGLGYVHLDLGDPREALSYFKKAREKYGEGGFRAAVAGQVMRIGDCQSALGNQERALESYAEAQREFETMSDLTMQAVVFRKIGNLFVSQGKFVRGMEQLEAALRLTERIGNLREKAETIEAIARLHRESGRLNEAEEDLNKSLQIHRMTLNSFGQAYCLSQIAALTLERGDRLIAAARHLDSALELIESVRAHVAGPRLRSTYMSSIRDIYRSAVEVKMKLHALRPEQGFDKQAFLISDRGRARTLLDSLSGKANVFKEGESSLAETERQLRSQINALLQELEFQRGEGAWLEAQVEIDAKLSEYRRTLLQLSANNLGTAAPGSPQLNLNEVQEDLLEEDTVVLQYGLGNERSYLWLLTKDSLQSFELKPGAELEDQALQLHSHVSGGNRRKNERPLDWWRRTEPAFRRLADELGKSLLGPVIDQIEGKRLVIVADSGLRYLPFAALSIPVLPAEMTLQMSQNEYVPLVERHEIVYLPSVSALPWLRHRMGRHYKRTLTVFADPVYEQDDPRLSDRSKSQFSHSDSQNSGLVDDLRNLSPAKFPTRLFASRAEAKSILRLVSDDQGLGFMDFDANYQMATSEALTSSRIVHFATHAIVQDTHPELSAIILSLWDPQGRRINGHLRLYDLFGLNLSADLVVLSACSTALGTRVDGEGLVGMARGFMHSGARHVIASQWPVDDQATSRLMALFYTNLLNQEIPTGSALRKAQNELRKQERWESPYYWAAFVLQGDWSYNP